MKLDKWTMIISTSVLTLIALLWLIITKPADRPWWLSRDQAIDMRGIRYEELQEKGILPALFPWEEVFHSFAEGRNLVLDECYHNTLVINRKNIKSIKWPKGKIIIEFKEKQ